MKSRSNSARMLDMLFGKKKKRTKATHECLRCGVYATSSLRAFESHAKKCGEGDGGAVFLGGMTQEEVDDIPKKERRSFLGLNFLP